MPRLRFAIAGGLAASLALFAHSASAETAEDGKAQAAPYLSDTETISGAPNVVLGTVVNSTDLTSGSAEVGLPYGEGFSSEDWELDENVGEPVFAMTDRALAAKGKPSLAEQGVDTSIISNGLSLDPGQSNVGTMTASAPSNAVMGAVGDLIGSLVP